MSNTEIMHKIDEILYGEHEQPYSKGDQLLMLIAGIRQETYQNAYIQGGIDAINRPYPHEIGFKGGQADD